MSTRFHDIAGSILIPGIIPTGNLLWVDAVNGNDSMAVRGRLSLPFKTLVAAKNAAVSAGIGQPQDTIVVMPGIHTTSENLAKNNVHWHLMQGALIQGASSASIFKLDSAIGMRVSGDGELLGGHDHAVEVTHASANLFLKCRKIVATDSCIRMTAGASAYVEADSFVSDEASCIDLSGGTLHVRARTISSEQVYALRVTGGTLDAEAYWVYSNAAEAIEFNASSANVSAFEIYSNTTQAVKYTATYANALTLRNARVVSKAAPSSGNYKPAIMITGAGGKLSIMNCTMIGVNNGASIPVSIDTTLGSSTNVLLYGLSVANFIAAGYASLDTSRYIIDATLT